VHWGKSQFVVNIVAWPCLICVVVVSSHQTLVSLNSPTSEELAKILESFSDQIDLPSFKKIYAKKMPLTRELAQPMLNAFKSLVKKKKKKKKKRSERLRLHFVNGVSFRTKKAMDKWTWPS
jgi:hypothetical protein